jgi:hypothetical protein
MGPSETKEQVMDVLLLIASVVAGLAVFDALAHWFGVDSRDRVGDDWARSLGN